MKFTVAGLLFAAVLPIAGAYFSSREPAQLPFGETDVPYPIRVNQGAGAIRNGFQEGRIHTSSMDKRVLIVWTSSAIANQAPNWAGQWSSQHNAIDGNKAQGGTQEFGTRFFPTASCVLAADAILVAGVTTSGSTVIERWSFGWPSPMPAPAVNIQTGITSVSVALPSRTNVQRIYDADVVGRKFVRNLCALRRQGGAPVEALAQFYDSNDVYSIGVSGGQPTLLASAVDDSGMLGLVPGLAPKNHSAIHFGDRSSVGYVYTLRRGMKFSPQAGNPNAPPVVVLVDSNRDGGVDSALQMTELEHAQQGWLNLDSYNSWWLY